jgi:hypothetical protein
MEPIGIFASLIRAVEVSSSSTPGVQSIVHVFVEEEV